MSLLTSEQLTTPHHDAASMLAACQVLVREEVAPQVEQWDRDDVLPASVLSQLGELGVPGALVPARYGGPELTVAELVEIWRTLSQGWISITGAVNTTYLATALLVRYGTDAQRERWLPGIASGAIWASFSITEPDAGSDLRRLSTRVTPVDGGMIVDGEKRWIAGGKTFAVTFMLALEEGAERPSCVILPSEGRGGEGWSVEMLDKIGYRGVESAAWRFDHHFAPGAEILGGEAGSGRGTRQMIDVLAVGRVNVACRALGIIDRALECAIDEATHREIGQGLLGQHSHAQMAIGEIWSRQRVVEAAIRQAAAAVDTGAAEAGEIASAVKVLASETAVTVVNIASRLAASRSYTAGSELARLRRDAPQTQIGEGANDSLLLAMGRDLIKRRSRAAAPAPTPPA
jgi:alkylation response protein AidB-like acyl-CoA dehydrogenase